MAILVGLIPIGPLNNSRPAHNRLLIPYYFIKPRFSWRGFFIIAECMKNFITIATTPFKKYTDFQGRAGRREFWFFQLFIVLVSILSAIIDDILNTPSYGDYGLAGLLFFLSIIIPNMALLCRRLHDFNRPGWWMLAAFIPLLGIIAWVTIGCLKGDEADNQYGSPSL